MSLPLTGAGFSGTSLVPQNITLPELENPDPYVGYADQCDTGVWTNSPTSYAYLWYLDAAPTAETSDTYTVQAEDEGKQLSCKVTASNASGSSSPAQSLLSNPITGGP